jgi:hypothetical protein
MAKHLFWLLLLIPASKAVAQNLKDTIFFLNGTRVIGKIKSIKLGVMTFDPDDANDITVQLRKLKAIAAVRQVFRVETIHNQVYFGKMYPHSLPGYAMVQTSADTVELPIEEISVLYPFKNSFWQRFSGNASAGFDFTRSSGLGRLNFDGALNYKSKKQEISLSASGIYTITDSTFSHDREDVGLKYNHYFTTTWFGTLLLKYQRNLELGLDRRYQEGAGAGNKFITSRHVYAWTRLGVVFNQEENTEGIRSGTLTELSGQFEFDFFRFTKPEVRCSITQAFYYGLTQKGRFRNDGQTDLNWEIFKDFRFALTLYNSLDSQPPTEGSPKADYGIVVGFTYIF